MCDKSRSSAMPTKIQKGSWSRLQWIPQGASCLQRALCDKFMRIAPPACPPQALQIVELARPRGEDMHDEVDVVHKDPLAFDLSFDMQRPYASLFESFFDLFRNCLVMACRSAGANQEVI